MNLRFTVRVEDAELAERVIAEVWAAGSSGVEDEGTMLRVYAPGEAAEQVRSAALRTVAERGTVDPLEAVEDVDWSMEWRRGLTAQVISERLVVRASFVAHEKAPGQLELIVEPGQAFGTGGHESTRLALEWIDVLLAGRSSFELAREARVLDVGSGTGVLALAAVGLGAAFAIGIDTDRVAVAEARQAAQRNGLGGCAKFVAGSLDALDARAAGYDLVVANLLRSEVTPLLARIRDALLPDALAVFSGLLASERVQVEEALHAAGLEILAWRSCRDRSRGAAEAGDDWVAPLARRRRDPDQRRA